MPSAPNSLRLFVSFALALSVTAGCGDEKVVAIGGGPGDVASDTSALPDGYVNPTPSGRELIVLHDASQPLQVRVSMNQLLRVKLVDYGVGGPAVGAMVRFALRPTNPAVTGDASLSALTANTDASGIAAVTFRANSTGDVSYTVDVSVDNAAPVSFDVFVANAPRGTLSVDLKYEGPISVKNLHVRLASGQYTCTQFNPVRPSTDILGEKTLLGLGGSEVSWPNLPEAQRFTVFATAESTEGHLAAAGCLDGVVIVPNQDNRVTLTLFMLSLNPTGTYDSTSVFDFTGAIPGELGDLVDEIALLFESPGEFLIERIKDLAAAYVGQLITNAVFGLFEDQVAEVIDDWMFNESPYWLQDIWTIGQDLFQIVNNLELPATLQISKLTNEYYVQGVLLWDGVVLYWRLGCAEEWESDYDPNCGRNEFSLDAFTDTEFPMDIIEGRFTASVTDFNQLDVDNHVIKLNYGKLILFALNEMVLPALTGEHNITDAVLSFVDCAAIADGIYFTGLSTIGIDESDIEWFCESGIELITRPVSLILSGLAIDSQMRMSGHAVLTDDNDDLNVDHVEDGQFIGNFESNGAAGEQFTGSWWADKRGAP